MKKVCRRRPIGEDPLLKVRRRRPNREGTSKKFRWKRSDGEDDCRKRGLTSEPTMALIPCEMREAKNTFLY